MEDNIFKSVAVKTEKLPHDNNEIKESKENIAKELESISEEIKKVKDISGDYLRIDNLCSKGKLTAPKVIHIRDVNIEDIFELTEEDSIAQSESVVRVLERITKEGIDGTQFSEPEIIEIFIRLYANFVSKTLRDYPYELDEEEEEKLKSSSPKVYEAYKKGDNPFSVDIEIENINFIELPDNFKEPINIKDDTGFTISFRLPRYGDILIIEKYLRKKYDQLDKKYYPILQKLRKEEETEILDTTLSADDRKDCRSFLKQKTIDYSKTLLALLLEKVGNKKLTTIEEKIKKVPDIPISLWQRMGEVLEKDLVYGPPEKVKVISPITGKSVLRGYSFRPMEVLQNYHKKENSEITISFG